MIPLRYILLLLFSSIFFFQSCSRKADGEEEMKVMIVGTWKARVKGSSLVQKQRFHIMEFTHDGRYRELTREDAGGNDREGWNSADTTGFRGFDLYIAFGDSVYYYIDNSVIKFYNGKSMSVPADKEVEWIKPDKLKIQYRKYDDIFKYEKI